MEVAKENHRSNGWSFQPCLRTLEGIKVFMVFFTVFPVQMAVFVAGWEPPRKKIQQWGFQWENHRTRMDFPAASHVWWHRTGGEIPMIFPLFLVNPHMFSHIWPVFYWKILEVHFLLIGMCSKYPQCFSHLYWKLNPSFSDRKTTEETGLFPAWVVCPSWNSRVACIMA